MDSARVRTSNRAAEERLLRERVEGTVATGERLVLAQTRYIAATQPAEVLLFDSDTTPSASPG